MTEHKEKMKSLLLDGLFLGNGLRLQTGVGSCSKFLLELVDAAGGINEFQLAGIERMAFATNVNLQLGANAAGRERCSATARNRRRLVLWVNAVFHFLYRIFAKGIKTVGFVQQLDGAVYAQSGFGFKGFWPVIRSIGRLSRGDRSKTAPAACRSPVGRRGTSPSARR